jgi:hypothetical protein
MKDKRLSFESDGDVEGLLLRAGRAGAPPRAKKRAFLAASGAAAASTIAAAEGTAAAAKLGSLAALKWVGVVCLTGIGAAAGATALRAVYERPPQVAVAIPSPRPTPLSSKEAPTARANVELAPAPAPIVVDEPTPSAPVSPVLPVPPPAVVAPSAVRAARQTAEPHKPAASTVELELSALDQARTAMGAGNTTRALSLLDGYRARFPRGEMQPEATMLRIEALCRAGDRDSAERYARAFLAGDPANPYTKRVRSLLASSNP